MATISRRYAVTKLLGSEPLVYIRAQKITCTYGDARPNTVLHVFIDGLKYNHRVQSRDWSTASSYKAMGEPVTASLTGNVDFIINLEGGKFKAGDLEIIATEASDLSLLGVSGNTLGKLDATFVAQGTLQVFRKTISILDADVIDPPPPPPPGGVDPLAQSFFTYGKQGGVFITSIDLYFYTKDSTFPVTVDLRQMENGYPTQRLVSEDAVATLYPSQISTSTDASVSTKFTFPVPIYIEQDKEVCFVVKSNCNTYQMWASKMGEKSNETKKTIFEQPYTGSLFKSQNESTWTTDQFEDLKFKLNIADFTSDSATVTLGGDSSNRWVKGSQFFTTSGSNKVIYRSFEQHGYTLFNGNERITLNPISTHANASYNGILGANLAGAFNITRIVDDYAIEFQLQGSGAGYNATSTGPIESCGVITHIVFENQTADSPIPTTLIIPAPISGTQATATVVTASNYDVTSRFIGTNITNPGSGYTQNVTVDAGTWPGNVTAYCEAWFNVSINKPISMFVPNIEFATPVGTTLRATHRLLDTSYQYAGGDMPTDMYAANFALYESILANRATSVQNGETDASFKMNVELSTSQQNVSPVLDLRKSASVTAYAYAINDQAFVDDVTSTLSSSSVTGYTSLYGGSGYVSAPTVTIVPAEDEPNKNNIVTATATAAVSGGAVTALTISGGSGYTRAPTIVIAAPAGAGNQATAVATINKVNSELLPSNGYALSRYITKEIKLETISTGIKVISFLASTPDTSVDWYVKTSLSSDVSNQADLPWRRLNCDVARNRSTSFNDLYDFEFYLYDLPNFDTYTLKCVQSSKYKNMTPIIKNYRVIVVV